MDMLFIYLSRSQSASAAGNYIVFGPIRKLGGPRRMKTITRGACEYCVPLIFAYLYYFQIFALLVAMAGEYVVNLSGGGPWGFRLQGGKDFGTALSIARVRFES